jgi:methyl-accepting chemotaxis protein
MGLMTALQVSPAGNWLQLFRRGAELIDRLCGRRSFFSVDNGILPHSNGNLGLKSSRWTAEDSASTFAPKPAMMDPSAFRTELVQGATSLEAECKSSEAGFLQLGSQLQTIHGDAKQLTQHVVDILAADKDLTIQGALKAIQTHAAVAMQDLRRCHLGLDADLSLIKDIQGALGTLLSLNQSFKKIAKNLKMVGLNISIESSRSLEAKATFQALAEEIIKLAGTVHTVAGNIGDDTTFVRENLGSIQSQTCLRSQSMEGLLASTQSTVNEALEHVASLMQLTMAALDRIGAKAREIGEQVGHLVVGIQIHDSIAQRAAHIHTGLDESAALLTSKVSADAWADTGDQALGKAVALIRLQTTQLHTIVEDVAAVHGQSETALDKLLAAVAEVARLEVLDPSDGDAKGCFDSASSHLKGALLHLLALLDEGMGNIRQLNAARQETSRTITRLGQHMTKVQDINSEIRLKALNAVIQSSRLGQTGKAMEAIVNELKELAVQSNSAILAVSAILEKIASASDALDQTSRNAQAEADSAGHTLRSAIKAFDTSCEAFKKQSQSALEMAQRLQLKVAQARQGIGFFQRLKDYCHEYHARLSEITTRLEPYAAAAPCDWMEKDETLRKRYTMQREREIHQHIYGGGQPNDSPAAEPLKVNEPHNPVAQELGDNIELF